MRTRRLQLPVAVAAGILALAACGSDGDGGTDDAPPVTTAADGPTDVSPGATAPDSTDATTSAAPDPSDPTAPVVEILDVEAPAIGGGTFDLATLSGQPVALWFWAPT